MKNKLKVMNKKPEVSDAELERFMDFDQLLRKQSAYIKSKRIQYVVGGSSLIAIVALFSWMLFSSQEELQSLPNEELFTENTEPIVENVVEIDSVEFQSENIDKPALQKSTAVQKEQVSTPPAEVKKEIVEPVYVQSAPVEGYASLYAYFEKELVYPQEAIADSIQGTVTVHCIIGKDGIPRNVQIENSLGELFDKEVNRIIENMPAWKPATLNDAPMDSKITLPLSFKLKTSDHD